jgi:hypothetical protein
MSTYWGEVGRGACSPPAQNIIVAFPTWELGYQRALGKPGVCLYARHVRLVANSRRIEPPYRCLSVGECVCSGDVSFIDALRSVADRQTEGLMKCTEGGAQTAYRSGLVDRGEAIKSGFCE